MKTTLHLLLQGLQATLLALSLAVIAWPACRTGTLRLVFSGVMFLACAAGTLGLWRRGALRLSPEQIFARARAGERFSNGALDRISTLAGAVAAIVLIYA